MFIVAHKDSLFTQHSAVLISQLSTQHLDAFSHLMNVKSVNELWELLGEHCAVAGGHAQQTLVTQPAEYGDTLGGGKSPEDLRHILP